jgi:hypothetical protein
MYFVERNHGFYYWKGGVSALPSSRQFRYDIPTVLYALKDREQMIWRFIYPSPFLPSGIEFEMSEEGIVSIDLIDGSGATIIALVHEEKYSRGTYRIELPNKAGLPLPCYYRLTVKVDETTVVETKPFPVSHGNMRMDEEGN